MPGSAISHEPSNPPGQVPATVIGMIRQAAADAPHHPVILFPDRESLTFQGLLELTERSVQALNAMGLRPSDRMVIAIPSSVEAAVAILTISTGVPVLPLSPDLMVDEYARYIAHIKAAAVLVQQGYPSQARDAARRLGIRLIEMAPVADAPAGTFAIVGADDLPVAEPQFSTPDDMSILIHTSGTTGAPKIVPRTQRGSMTFLQLSLAAIKDPPSTSVNVMPLYHIGGAGSLFTAVGTRSSFTCIPRMTVDEIYRFLALYRPKSLNVVPAILASLVHEAPQHEAELRQFQLERISVGSAALPEELLQQVEQLFGATVEIGYGMSEVLRIAGTRQSTSESSYRPGSVGKPWPVTQVCIADEAGSPVPQGEIGEITVRSPLMFRGYLDNPEATAEAFRDGWFRTGDAGYLDADGYLYLVGRLKEVINRGGSKISPLDVEAVIVQHPAVREAAAFGFPHAALGEDLAMAVVLKDVPLAERELRRFAAERLPLVKVPSRFVFVDELPRTALGKVRRNALGEQFGPDLKR